MTTKKMIGTITHYFPNVGVAVVKLTDSIQIGDNISIAIEEGIDMGKRSSQGDERAFWMSRGGFSEWRERIIAERMSNINNWLNNFDFVREHLKELEALERMKGLADEDIEFFRSMGIKIEE